MQPPIRPPHLIRPDEVAAWLAGSRVQSVTYHRTDPFSGREILEHGVDVQRNWLGSFGQGFYTSTVPDEVFGDVELVVAIRLLDPLVGDESQLDEVIVPIAAALGSRSGRITPEIAAGIRRELVKLGYDGIVVNDGGGDGVDYVSALTSENVRVVVE